MKKITIALMIFLMITGISISFALGQSPTGTDFHKAVTDYQQSQTPENAEKVIKMAAAMEQLPPIPEEARKNFVQGVALFKDAKSPDDFKLVIEKFTQAVNLAPWWPDARYNLALAYVSAGDNDLAITNLKLYHMFNLSRSDAQAAQDKIWALEAKQEKKQEKATEATRLSQRRWVLKEPYQYQHNVVGYLTLTLRIKGTDLIKSNVVDLNPGVTLPAWLSAGIHPGVPSGDPAIPGDGHSWRGARVNYHLSEDGTQITSTYNENAEKEIPGIYGKSAGVYRLQ